MSSINRSENGLWIGFLMGAAVASGGLYLFGTKSGRIFLKKLIDGLDNIELSAEEIISEIGELIEKEAGTVKKNEFSTQSSGNIDMVIDKIKRTLPFN